MTEAEKKLWNKYLRQTKNKALRQKPIDDYIVDFYIPKLKLIIEIDGDSHFTEEGKTYDTKRTKILGKYGLRIIRFNNKEVLEQFKGVCAVIEEICKGKSPSFPL